MTEMFRDQRKATMTGACLCFALLAPCTSQAATASATPPITQTAATARPASKALPQQDFTVEIRQVEEGSRGGKTYGTESPRDLMETQQLQVRNGEKASLRISMATPVQWVQSAEAQSSTLNAGGTRGASATSTGGKVKQALTWLESGQTITLTPTWRGGKQPVVVDIDVQTASVQANPGGDVPKQARNQWVTSVSAPMGEWVTLASSGDRPQRTTYSSESASETRLRLEMRVVVR